MADAHEVFGKLRERGFKASSDEANARMAAADAAGMSERGPYTVLGVVKKGRVTVTVERNTAPEDLGGGTEAVVTYPPVAVVEHVNGRRAAANPDDWDALTALLEEFEGERA